MSFWYLWYAWQDQWFPVVIALLPKFADRVLSISLPKVNAACPEVAETLGICFRDSLRGQR